MTDLPTHPYDAGTHEALSRLVERFTEINRGAVDARLVKTLKASGEYDTALHGALDTELSEGEHVAILAYGAAIARQATHPIHVHDAVRAGVPWAKIARALDQTEAEARAAYVRWANNQRSLAATLEAEGNKPIGITEAEHAEALARAAEGIPQGHASEQRFIEHVTSRGWVEQTRADQWTSGAQAADRLFSVGDVVRLHVDLNVSYVDDDLAAEGEDARVRVRRPRGSVGIVTKVRDYQTPFPYVVMFGDQEASVAERDLERVAPESGER